MQLAERLRQIFSLDETAWAIEFESAQYSWGALRSLSEKIIRAIKDTGVKEYDVAGWAAENSPAALASLAALAISEHCAAVLNPHLAPKTLAAEIEIQKFPVILGDRDFWEIPGVPEAAKSVGSAGLVVTWDGPTATVEAYPGLERVGPGSHRDPMPKDLIELVSSGTTGPPKRTPQSKASMLKQLELGQRKERKNDNEPLTLKRSPSIIFRALAHGGGAFAVLLALYSGRPISLHKKFKVEAAVDAIRRHRPKVASFVPTMIKMIWDAQVPVDDLSSLIAIRTGTAPLDPKLQSQFEDKYGIPILIDYGASEFGGVAAWTLADHKKYAKQKRGSVGRAVAGAQLRIVDQETGNEILDGRVGLLEVKIERKATGWIPTTDIASIDADGFLFIHGRADDAIVRGGFKILPEEVAQVLRQHPDVRDVAVIGVPDDRLGQVPVAVIETRDEGAVPDEAILQAYARDHLTPYQVPVKFKFTNQLPRSASMKVIKSELLELARS